MYNNQNIREPQLNKIDDPEVITGKSLLVLIY